MRKANRTSLAALALTAVIGVAVGWLLQLGLVSRGIPTLVPPLSLPVTLAIVGAVLLVFGIRLRRTVRRRPGDVNPFHAVRLLVTASAAQFVGTFFGAFGAGLWLALASRSVPPPASIWFPMLATLLGGAVLVACAMIAEYLCRVPPGDENGEQRDPGDADEAPRAAAP